MSVAPSAHHRQRHRLIVPGHGRLDRAERFRVQTRALADGPLCALAIRDVDGGVVDDFTDHREEPDRILIGQHANIERGFLLPTG